MGIEQKALRRIAALAEDDPVKGQLRMLRYGATGKPKVIQQRARVIVSPGGTDPLVQAQLGLPIPGPFLHGQLCQDALVFPLPQGRFPGLDFPQEGVAAGYDPGLELRMVQQSRSHGLLQQQDLLLQLDAAGGVPKGLARQLVVEEGVQGLAQLRPGLAAAAARGLFSLPVKGAVEQVVVEVIEQQGRGLGTAFGQLLRQLFQGRSLRRVRRQNVEPGRIVVPQDRFAAQNGSQCIPFDPPQMQGCG